MLFFRDIRFELKYMFDELILIIKHPTRKASHTDFKYHWSRLCDTIIFHPWYCLKRGLRNIYIWFPTIWGNDSWDYSYLCNMMDLQMKEMEDLWLKTYLKDERKDRDDPDGCPVGWRCQHHRKWKRIKWSRKLMQMWRDEHYTMKAYYENKELFPKDSFLETDDSKTTYDEFGVPVLYTCKPMSEDCSEDYRMRNEKARKMEAKVFKLWQKNIGYIHYWWY